MKIDDVYNAIKSGNLGVSTEEREITCSIVTDMDKLLMCEDCPLGYTNHNAHWQCMASVRKEAYNTLYNSRENPELFI